MQTFTANEIKYAIGHSIRRDETACIESEDPTETLAQIDNDESVTELDHAVENDGSLDVWGKRQGGDFRLRLRLAK